MKSSKSKRLRAIGLFIVLAAMIVSFMHNGISPRAQGINSRETDRYYEELTNTNKVKLEVNVKSIDLLKNLVANKLDAQGSVKLSSEEQSNSCLYVYQINPQSLAPIIAAVSEIGSIISKTERTSSNSSQIDLLAKLRDKQILHDKAFEDYKNSKNPISSKLIIINDLQSQIDTLKFQIANQKNQEMTVLYIKAQVAASGTGKFAGYKNLLLDFVRYVIMFSVAVAVLYFGTILLVYIFSLLGIRFPSFSSLLGKGYNDYAGYKGYRGYGSYGYGGNRKRRVKRIYRNKHSSDSEKSDESPK
jgi:hypothetical protein